MSGSDWILTPDAPADVGRMGGKAASLAKLGRLGLPVPPWFVVMPAACSGPEEPDANDPAALQPAADAAEAIEAAVRRLASDGELLAVRSSAASEDGAAHSFAGQFESFLAVPAETVLEKVAAVWRSGFSERVLAYRREHGLDGPPEVPAVLVQRMIDAEAAGVAFASDPVTGRRSVAVVSAVYGLGTALVGGEADADTFRIDRNGAICSRDVATKPSAHRPAPGKGEGVAAEPVTEDRQQAPAISDGQAAAVAELAGETSRKLGRPQDIEWAIDREGTLWLLQARPITSLASLPDPDGRLQIWDNANIAESYSGVTTPLTFSFARRAYEGVYREFCLMMGVPRQAVTDAEDVFRHMLGLIRGRVYYNLLNWYRLLAMLPGFGANRQFMEQMMGVREGLPDEIAGELAEASWMQRQRDRLRLLRAAGGLAAGHLTLPRRIQQFYARLNDALRDPEVPLEQMRLDELAGEYRRLETRLLTRWDAPLVNDFLAMIFFGVLGKLCEKWCRDDYGRLRNDLLSGEGGIISTEPARRIGEMGELARQDPALAGMLREAEPAEALAELEEHHELSAAWEAYIAKFGDRCLQELKLESATLRDDPTPLLRAVGHAANRAEASQGENFEQQLRHDAERRAAETMRWRPGRRALFRWVLRHARGRVRDRENLRFERTRLFGRVRQIFFEIGRRLADEGILDAPRDVFYHEVEEVLGFIEGSAVTTDLRGLARLRQSEFARYEAAPPPADRFETRGAVHVGNPFQAHRPSRPAGDGEAICGTGCYPGIVRGPVRIVRDPRGAQLRPGEILVAQQTDPGWILLFPAAAGILVQRGSLLSHSAIVAREMGIPAIVAIPDLLDRLEDGQWVEIDGASGLVQPVAAPEDAEVSLAQ
ncbi:MAG: PEP/pyruvate-binding domain-containing protein [Phycisphaeraceae bacterium]